MKNENINNVPDASWIPLHQILFLIYMVYVITAPNFWNDLVILYMKILPREKLA